MAATKKRVLIELSDEENQAPVQKSALKEAKKITGDDIHASSSSPERAPVQQMQKASTFVASDKASAVAAGTAELQMLPNEGTTRPKLSLSLQGRQPRAPVSTSIRALFAKAGSTTPSITSVTTPKATSTKVELVPSKVPVTPTKAPLTKATTPTKVLPEDDLLASLGVSTSPSFGGARSARATPSQPSSFSEQKKMLREDGQMSSKRAKSSGGEIESTGSNEATAAKNDEVEDADVAGDNFALPHSPEFNLKSSDDENDAEEVDGSAPAKGDPIESGSDDVEEIAFTKPKAKPLSDISSWLKKPSAGSAVTNESDEPGEPLKLSDSHQVPACINKKLRDYQREGVKFLYSLYKEDKGGILADDMGLGKTIQTIAFISSVMFHQTNAGNWLVPKPGARSVLVVAPATVLEQWASECSKWKLRPGSVKIYRGPKRKAIYLLAKQGPPIVFITSYETMKNDILDLSTIDWEFVIMDEVHKIKGKESKVKDAAHQFKTMRRYGLTGTLLQNNLEELWVLMDWCTSSRFCTASQMRDGFIHPIKNGQRQECTKRELALGRSASKKLKEKLSDFVLRRDKKIIADKLPSKEDRIVFCPLTEMQMKVYKRILELPEVVALKESAKKCFCGSGRANGECHGTGYAPDGVTLLKNLVLPMQTALGKVCNHLQLMSPHPGKKPEEALKVLEFMKRSFGDEVLEQYRKCVQTEDHVSLSGKICVLKTLLPEWYKQGHKVLLFSKSTRTLDLIEKLLRSLRLSFSRLDGSTQAPVRQRVVDEFNKSNFRTRFIFLLSTKAGGLGLNLVSANIVVVFDPNWNASHDLQAQDRAYRLGQTKDTKVFRLVATGTIEELMYQRQVYKQQLHNITIHGQYEKRWFKGVQGVKGEEGDLFGILNLLTLSEEKVITKEIMKRTNDMYKDFMIEDNKAADEEDVNAEMKSLMEGNFDDAEKLVKEVQEEEAARFQAAIQNTDEDLLRRAGVLYSHNNQSLLGDNAVERRLSAAAEREVATEELMRSQFAPAPLPSQRYAEPRSYTSERAFPATPNTPAYQAAMSSSWRLPVSAAVPSATPLSASYASPPVYPARPSSYLSGASSQQLPPPINYTPIHPPSNGTRPPAPTSFRSYGDLEAARAARLEAHRQMLADAVLPPQFRLSVQSALSRVATTPVAAGADGSPGFRRADRVNVSPPGKGTGSAYVIDLSDD